MKIKGRYVGLVMIDFDLEEGKNGVVPFAELDGLVKEKLTEIIKADLQDEIGEIGTVSVVQQYADLYRVADEREGDRT